MRLELNFYKNTGKWYTTEIIELVDVNLITYHVIDNNLYPGMDYTVHIIAPDGVLIPYRFFKR